MVTINISYKDSIVDEVISVSRVGISEREFVLLRKGDLYYTAEQGLNDSRYTYFITKVVPVPLFVFALIAEELFVSKPFGKRDESVRYTAYADLAALMIMRQIAGNWVAKTENERPSLRENIDVYIKAINDPEFQEKALYLGRNQISEIEFGNYLREWLTNH